jgi:hypothetical protein
MGLAATLDGGFLIADHDNRIVRKVSPEGVITRVAGVTGGSAPGELRVVTRDHVHLNRGTIHVWRSASKERRHQDTEVEAEITGFAAAYAREGSACHRAPAVCMRHGRVRLSVWVRSGQDQDPIVWVFSLEQTREKWWS